MRAWWSAQEAILNANVSENEKTLARGFLSAILKLSSTHADDATIARAIAVAELGNGLDCGPVLSTMMPRATDMTLGEGKADELRTLTSQLQTSW